MKPAIYAKFIKFLKEELALSNGLVTLEELDRIYDWLYSKTKLDLS